MALIPWITWLTQLIADLISDVTTWLVTGLVDVRRSSQSRPALAEQAGLITRQKRLARFQDKVAKPARTARKLINLIEVPVTDGPGRYLPAAVPDEVDTVVKSNQGQVYFPCRAMSDKAMTVTVEVDREAPRRWCSKVTAGYLSGDSKFLSQYLKGYDYPVISLELHYNNRVYLNFEVVDVPDQQAGSSAPKVYLSQYD